tara:strand:+ start:1280 stop:2674 length:1395 start_codon:yes stop_codon:yes gene_type:complete
MVDYLKDKRTIGGKVTERAQAVEAGTMKSEEAVKGMAKEWQSIMSAQLEVNKLLKNQEDQHKGIYGAMLQGIGLTKDHTKEMETLQQKLEEKLKNAREAREEDQEKYEEDIRNIEASIAAAKKAEQAQKEAIEEFEGLFPGLTSGVKQIQSGFKTLNIIMAANPLLAIAAIITAIVALVIQWVKAVNSVVEQFGVTREEARKINVQLALTNIKMKFFGISAEQVKASMEALADTFGEVSPAMVRFSGDMALVARNSGISADEAASMVSLFQASHGATKEIALDMIRSTKEMAALTGLSPGIILSELAEQSDLFASHLGQSEQHLIAAVSQAKKLGMEFNTLNEFGDGLVDIAERINKEQMLSAMLGRDVNLERAAQLQVQGDELGYMQELASQMQGFKDLSAFQRRQFAAEMGIAVSDIMKLTGLQTGMAQKSPHTPGQNPYEQAIYKQGERILSAINNPQYAR